MLYVLLVLLVVEMCGLATGGVGAVAQPRSVPADVSTMPPFTYTTICITNSATHCIISAAPGERIEVVGFALVSTAEGWVSVHPAAVDGQGSVLGTLASGVQTFLAEDGAAMGYWQPAPDDPWALPVGRDLHVTCDVPLRGWVAHRKVMPR